MKSFTFHLAIFFALMSLTYGQSTFLPCADGSPPPIFFDNKCTEPVCNFTSGHRDVIIYQFTAPYEITSLKHYITFVNTADLENVETYETEVNACDNLSDAQCPLEAGKVATYVIYVIIPSYGADYIALVEERLVDQNNSTVACFYHLALVDESATK